MSLSAACGGVPKTLSSLPDHVDIFEVESSKKDSKAYGFIGKKHRPGTFTHSVEAPKQGKKHSVECERSFSPSKMCEEMEIVCRTEDDEVTSRITFRQDGYLKVRLGPPWESTPEDLVEVHLLVVEPLASSLYGPGVKELNAQLVEGIVESQSLTHRSGRTRARSSWFNQLSVSKDGIYMAVHQSHPHYLQVVSSLNLVGKLWKENSPHFEDCGFSSR